MTATLKSFSHHQAIHHNQGVKDFCCSWGEREWKLDDTKMTFCNSSLDVMDGNGDDDENSNNYDNEVDHGDCI